MKLCFSTLACPNWTLPQIIGAASAHGLDGVDFRGLGPEIDITRLDRFNAELPNTLDMLRQNRLEVPCLNTSVTLVTPAADRWQMMLDEAERYAVLAEKLSSKYLRVFGGGIPKGMSRDEARALAQRHLRQLTKIVNPHKCQVVLETHDNWSVSGDVLSIVGDFATDEVGVLWDLQHPWNHGDSPAQTADALRPYLRHIHTKDFLKKDGKDLCCLMGEGILPLAEIHRELKRIGYDGWFCLEIEKRWQPETCPEPEVSIPQFAKYMRAAWA